jgi:hypothetical protein
VFAQLCSEEEVIAEFSLEMLHMKLQKDLNLLQKLVRLKLPESQCTNSMSKIFLHHRNGDQASRRSADLSYDSE